MEWWHRCTLWFKEDGKLYFTHRDIKKDPGHILLNRIHESDPTESDAAWEKRWEACWSKLKEKCEPLARPSEKCLKAVLDHASIKLGVKLEFAGTDTKYGTDWYEAKISVKHKNKEYLLTWMNCD